MPRDLKQTDRNELKIDDAISGCTLALYYRQPTTQERIDFQRASFVRKGKKLTNRRGEAQVEFGTRILTGIREGDFSTGTSDSGEAILISSDIGSENYCPEWKEHVSATAGDLLMLLGMNVFEGSMEQLLKKSADSEEDDEDEDVVPLVSSSNG